jgi:hypothetical protein
MEIDSDEECDNYLELETIKYEVETIIKNAKGVFDKPMLVPVSPLEDDDCEEWEFHSSMKWIFGHKSLSIHVPFTGMKMEDGNACRTETEEEREERVKRGFLAWKTLLCEEFNKFAIEKLDENESYLYCAIDI